MVGSLGGFAVWVGFVGIVAGCGFARHMLVVLRLLGGLVCGVGLVAGFAGFGLVWVVPY